LTVTKDDYSKIGILIVALCAITWLFLANSWGAESNRTQTLEKRERRPVDRDKDGYPSTVDCNDRNASIYPGATEIADDGIDQDCNGVDLVTSGGGGGDANPHAKLVWDGSAGVCLSCHKEQAREMYASTHYQWEGEALYRTSGPLMQGKISNAVNSYCINILGNWGDCGNCHVGLGAQPVATSSPTDAQLKNIDCLICHQKDYKRVKVNGTFVPDTANMTVTLNKAVQTVHLPERSNCLSCHAKAGGGDAVKRGDLALATANTSDVQFDRHMAVAGADMKCQECHITDKHRIAGRGSDLRQTDLDVEMACTNCHTNKTTTGGHGTADINRHVARVACQTCHIPIYAKNAGDTAADEATETHRTWLSSHATAVPYHPASTKANNLTPKYRFWNRYSYNYVLREAAQIDPKTGAYPTSRPAGAVDDTSPDNKLYPFKYKTAEQPMRDSTKELIALDTFEFFRNPDPQKRAEDATRAGLSNMGYSAAETFSWVKTDTFQLLNHQVSPPSQALNCAACHGSTARMNLKADLGYGLKGAETAVCSQCHGSKQNPGFKSVHDKHVKDKKYDCANCHGFTRPERGLR
jgi:hypothetical protein